MAIASAPFPAPESDAKPTPRDILIERIEVGCKSVGMVALTLHDGHRELVTCGRSGSDGVALDGDTVFEIGSITKVFTALLLADMVVRREAALNEPVAALLPAGTRMPERGKPITLLDLATHTSGLPRVAGNSKPSDPANPYAGYSAEQMLAFLASYELPREPGTHYEYSNLGFGLLGHALAARAAKPYEALVVGQICAPLGLGDTRITLTPSMKARRAQGHDVNLSPVPDWEFLSLEATGALRSTANDLATFLEAAIGRRPSPLQEAFALLLSTRRPADRPGVESALGWLVATGRRDEIVYKTGGTGGTRACIGWSRNSLRGAAVLSNTDWHAVDDIVFHLINPELPVKPERHAVALDPARLDGLVGRYKAHDFVIVVTRQGNRLFAKSGDYPMFEIFAASETEFFYRVADEPRLTFELGPDGRATAAVMHAEDRKDYRGLRL